MKIMNSKEMNLFSLPVLTKLGSRLDLALVDTLNC